VLLYKKGLEEKFTDHLFELWRYKNFDVKTFENLVPYNCKDECKYKCMHKTVEAYQLRRWKVPQFHGKWPFIRFIGMQEPASVFFSALNFFVHFQGIQEFRSKVHHDAPLFQMWHTFTVICMNAWTFSMIFHARDFPLTELLDYVFAYSMVLASAVCMIIR
jgi:hypothetical protein